MSGLTGVPAALRSTLAVTSMTSPPSGPGLRFSGRLMSETTERLSNPMLSTKTVKLCSAMEYSPNRSSHVVVRSKSLPLVRSPMGTMISCHFPSDRLSTYAMSGTDADSSLPLVEPARPTLRSLSSGAFWGSSTFRRIQKLRFLYGDPSVPAFWGQKPCQFHPKPFQSLPSACHSMPVDPFKPPSGVAFAVLLQASLRLQFAHALALPPCFSPSQTRDASLVAVWTSGALFPAASLGGGLMQLDETTSAATLDQVLVRECDMAILSSSSRGPRGDYTKARGRLPNASRSPGSSRTSRCRPRPHRSRARATRATSSTMTRRLPSSASSLGERGVRGTGPGRRLRAAVAGARLKLLNQTAALSHTVPLVIGHMLWRVITPAA